MVFSVHPSPHPLAQITSHTHKNNNSYPATGSLAICTAELVCSRQFVILDLPKLHSDFSVLVIIPLLKLVSQKRGHRKGCRAAAARPGPALPCLLIIAQAELAHFCQVGFKPFSITQLLQTVLAKAGNPHLDEEESKARKNLPKLTAGRTENGFDLQQLLQSCPFIQYTALLQQAHGFTKSGCQEMPARQEGSHCQDAKPKGI